MRHVGMIPLIGGEILASDEVYGTTPEYILSYSGFGGNEKHLLNYYKEQGHDIPYYVLDEDGTVVPKGNHIDVVSIVCPCAGLSSYHNKAGEDNPNNQWMEKSSEYILETIKPSVYWGENAPALAGKVGTFMKEKLFNIGQKNGYNMSIYLTKSLQHGGPQYRKRTFYFFWNKEKFDNKIPVFKYYNKPRPTIEDLIGGVNSNFQNEVLNKKIPSKDDPYYRFMLEVAKGGISHKEYVDSLTEEKSVNVESKLIKSGYTYLEIAQWMDGFGEVFEREAARARRKDAKLKSGGGVMLRGTIVPKNYIGAFVVHLPKSVTHPTEDRYLNFAEMKAIMGLPNDMELLEPEANYNHICQNVPYYVAKDMATEIKAILENKRDMVRTNYLFQNNLNQKMEYHQDLNNLDPHLKVA